MSPRSRLKETYSQQTEYTIMFIRSNLPSGVFSLDYICVCFDIIDESYNHQTIYQDYLLILIGA